MSIQAVAQVIEYLNDYIIGQDYAKKSIATLLCNHYNSQLLEYSDKITKTLLLQGPPGTGKTLLMRTASRFFQAPYVHISALSLLNSIQTGNVNTFLEQVMNKLIEVVIRNRTRHWKKKYLPNAKTLAQEKATEIIAQLLNMDISECRAKFEEHEYDDMIIPIQTYSSDNDKSNGILIHLPVLEAVNFMTEKELLRLLAVHDFKHEALEYAQKNSVLVFDNIDKLCIHHINDNNGNGKELEFAQHVLVQLLDGMSILTKYGPINTHEMILMLTGSFINTTPDHLIPELHARINRVINVESLDKYDLVRILTESHESILQQYLQLGQISNLDLEISHEGIEFLCESAYELNETVQNLGIRRVYAMLDAILQPIFQTNDVSIKTKITIDKPYIQMFFEKPQKKNDTYKYIL